MTFNVWRINVFLNKTFLRGVEGVVGKKKFLFFEAEKEKEKV